MLVLDLERLEALTHAHHEKAVKGDVAATAILLKVMEHRAALAGLFGRQCRQNPISSNAF